MSDNLYPTKEEADSILLWANEQNPGPWIDHCKFTALAAESIALKCNMDTEKSYVLGLLHDIGYHAYRNFIGKTCHIYSGYELMIEKEYDDVARICLTHSFPYKDFRAYIGTDMTCNKTAKDFISAFLYKIEYDDYDRLIQLCDCLSTTQGICIMEKRLISAVMKGTYNEFIYRNWGAYLELKSYFDKKCNMNINNIFYDEICSDIFHK
jgi:putative nucleotidyltransferase with HDIG domain